MGSLAIEKRSDSHSFENKNSSLVAYLIRTKFLCTGLSRQAAKDAYVELAKNVLPTRGHNLGSTDGVDENWVEVVRGVLPQVPVAVIRRELLVTKNVDDTIARILDGTVYYEPEVPTITPETSQISSKPSESSAPIPSEEPIEPNDPVSPMTFNTKAVSFERNSQQRMKSYQERKEQLLEVARKHFIEKYGLQPK